VGAAQLGGADRGGWWCGKRSLLRHFKVKNPAHLPRQARDKTKVENETLFLQVGTATQELASAIWMARPLASQNEKAAAAAAVVALSGSICSTGRACRWLCRSRRTGINRVRH
jgi:hypothetical protein